MPLPDNLLDLFWLMAEAAWLGWLFCQCYRIYGKLYDWLAGKIGG